VAICAFGLPAGASAFPTTQGVRAALAVVDTFERLGTDAFVGVTTDQLLCCCVGSGNRREVSPVTVTCQALEILYVSMYKFRLNHCLQSSVDDGCRCWVSLLSEWQGGSGLKKQRCQLCP
jgi:hypothetical protein